MSKAKLTLTFELPRELNFEETQHLLHLLLCDALSEFQSRRGVDGQDCNSLSMADAYVERRYPGNTVYRGENRTRKVHQVRNRCELAHNLKQAAFNLDLEPTFEVEPVG